MNASNGTNGSLPNAPSPLRLVVVELERHAQESGWDRPPTLYGLVDTAELVAAEPDLATALGLVGDPPAPGSLTPIEQESLGDGPLDETLARIAWPPAVKGCALIHEVVVLPPSAEAQLPDEADPATWAAEHEERQDVRMVVGVLRDGTKSCVLRVRAEDGGEPAFGDDLAPNLADALIATLQD